MFVYFSFVVFGFGVKSKKFIAKTDVKDIILYVFF